MALLDTSLTPRPTLSARLARLFETPFDRRSRALSDEVARLKALSDQELAAHGLSRETILFHVFGARARR
ncbi:hypothetical protein [Tropicibacter sp. S64]|uniref:hypothetical protein n=1 Tax=Tropicibacter sp. S64 TaxID=3415122 RepID=UPI003C7E3C62